MDSAYTLLVRLAEESYFPEEVPAAQDDSLAAAMMEIDSAGSFEDMAVRIDLEIGRVLNLFASRMATLTLRSRDSAPLVPALIAAQLAMMVDDFRDVLPTYAMVYRSAEEISVDAADLFCSTTLMLSNQWNETPAEFAKRDPALRTIAAMRIMLVDGPDGPGYAAKSA